MTQEEFLRARGVDPWNIPLPPEQIRVAWMHAAWKIDTLREHTLDLMGQAVSKAGRLGHDVGYLNLLDRALARRQVLEIYRGLRDFEPHRERDFWEGFERGFPRHSAALPPVRSDAEVIARFGPEYAALLGLTSEQQEAEPDAAPDPARDSGSGTS